MNQAEIRVEYKPTPKQRMFHQATANEVLFGGAAGGGKSKAIVMDALMRCMKHPGTYAYIFRRTYREIEGTIVREMQMSYPQGIGTYNVGRHEWKLINGSMIRCRHCAAVGDMYQYKGEEIHWLYFDELTSFEYDIYEFIKTRLRAKESLGITPLVRSSSNPGDIGHGWVKARFVDAGPYLDMVEHAVQSETLGRTEVFTTQYIPSLATENPYITDQYIIELEQKPPALRDAYLHGNWDAFEGQVFTEFVDDAEHYEDGVGTHVVKPFAIPPHWPRYMSFDWGYTAPFSVGWWAVAPTGAIIRYREWYGWNGTPNRGLSITVEEIADGIIQAEAEEAREGLAVDRIADPSIFDRSRGDSIAQKFAAKGVTFRKGDNTRLAGKAEMHERMRFREDGKPMLYVFDTCKQFLRTIPSLPYSRTKTEDVDTAAEDHVYDEARYMCMSRPLVPRAPRPYAPAAFDPFAEGGGDR